MVNLMGFEFRGHKFDRVEFAGSLGDLGTLIPLSVALIAINGLNATAVFLMVGLFYIGAGLYYKLPIPVQPLKVVAAIAIASELDAGTIAASGYLMGAILIFIAITGLIDALAKIFTMPIVKGIQVGLGIILMIKGFQFVAKQELLIGGEPVLVGGYSLNMIIGFISFLIVLFLLTNKRLPAAIAVILFGLVVSISQGALSVINWNIGPVPLEIFQPTADQLATALILLVIPQIPLTIGNAVMATSDASKSLFGEEKAKKSTFKALSTSMGLANLGAGVLAGMPMCHGAGGLAAHYRFGARTGGSDLMIGAIFLVIAIVFGTIAIAVLRVIPYAVLGILLIFAGLELTMLIKGIKEKKDFFVVFIIAGIAVATTNMGYAFIVGIIVYYVIKYAKIEF
jgi:SulP family sulfate permease